MDKNFENIDWIRLLAVQPAVALLSTQLRFIAKQIVASSGDTLFRIGDPVRHVYLVISGETRLIRRDRNGGEVILQRSQGGYIAEASLDALAYHCDAIVTSTTTLLLFPIEEFKSALDSESNFRKAWQSRLAQELRKLRAQCERLSLHSATDRITHYIESEGVNGAVTLNYSRKSWAAELGLTHEALYRALRRMQDCNMLEIDGHQFINKS
jgi:CRP/FNR family transcriptional regulator, dissimilatory nitrate respiration regulator